MTRPRLHFLRRFLFFLASELCFQLFELLEALNLEISRADQAFAMLVDYVHILEQALYDRLQSRVLYF